MPTITIDLTPSQAQRLSIAFGKYFNLKEASTDPRATPVPRAATIGDVEFFLRSELRKIVQIQERQDAEAAVVVPEF